MPTNYPKGVLRALERRMRRSYKLSDKAVRNFLLSVLDEPELREAFNPIAHQLPWLFKKSPSRDSSRTTVSSIPIAGRCEADSVDQLPDGEMAALEQKIRKAFCEVDVMDPQLSSACCTPAHSCEKIPQIMNKV
jgi:hypothetical protein